MGARRRGSSSNRRVQKGVAVVSAGWMGLELGSWVKGVDAWITQVATMLKVQRNLILSEGLSLHQMLARKGGGVSCRVWRRERAAGQVLG